MNRRHSLATMWRSIKGVKSLPWQTLQTPSAIGQVATVGALRFAANPIVALP